MTLQGQALVLVTLLQFLLLLLLIQIEGDSTPNSVYQNATGVSPSSSTSNSSWLKKVVKQRPSGCRGRPRACSKGEFPPRSLCCGNRCVNVTSDINNCGACGIRCQFNWQCCGGLCTNTDSSPFNCGRCGKRCPFGIFCFFGMCGYGQPSFPWPLPLPPPTPPSSPFLPRPPKHKPVKPPQPPHHQCRHPPGCHQPPPAITE